MATIEEANRYLRERFLPQLNAEFAVAPLLWNRLAELSAAGPAAALLERCQEFSAAAGLDGDVARQWALTR